MHDVKIIESNFDFVKKNLSKRNFDLAVLDEVLKLNKVRKELILSVEENRARVKTLSQEVGQLKKNNQDATHLMEQVTSLKTQNEENEIRLKKCEDSLNNILASIPNLLEDDTPPGKSDEDNIQVKSWGQPKVYDFKVLDHVTLGENLGMLDFEAASQITGSRFVVSMGLLAKLERALANFMLDHQSERGYQEVIPPFIVNDKALFGTGQLPKFSEDLFKIEGRDWYLIPTSEVPLTNLVREKILNQNILPLKFTALTPCFRSEAGSYGKDTRGLIRVHQFNKVEMVNISTPDQSGQLLEEMVKSASEILEKLELPYRVMRLCSGDIGFGSRKTYDLEVWLPSQNKYREISSCSNCGDFQARRASIRFRNNDGKPEYAHTLNGSGLAVGRTLVAILENHQLADGSVAVPRALQSYMGGLSIIKKG
jgi:seryl-tRNA synthetase